MDKIRQIQIFFVASLFVILATAVHASPKSGEVARWQVMTDGGGRGISTHFTLAGTVGQTSVGAGTSASFGIRSGFWQKFRGPNCCLGKTGNVDCDPAGGVDISDLSRLIDYLYISLNPLCCEAGANTDGSSDGAIDISDLSRLIDYLYIQLDPTANCL